VVTIAVLALLAIGAMLPRNQPPPETGQPAAVQVK
jgi:hypothetical protein